MVIDQILVIAVVGAILRTARISVDRNSGDSLSVVLAEATAAVATAVIVIEESINPGLPLSIASFRKVP